MIWWVTIVNKMKLSRQFRNIFECFYLICMNWGIEFYRLLCSGCRLFFRFVFKLPIFVPNCHTHFKSKTLGLKDSVFFRKMCWKNIPSERTKKQFWESVEPKYRWPKKLRFWKIIFSEDNFFSKRIRKQFLRKMSQSFLE